MITAWLAITVASVASADHRQQRPVRKHQKERVLDRFRIGNDQRALPQIIQRQRRQYEKQPGRLDRSFAEMPEIGIERLRAGDGEENRASVTKPMMP